MVMKPVEHPSGRWHISMDGELLTGVGNDLLEFPTKETALNWIDRYGRTEIDKRQMHEAYARKAAKIRRAKAGSKEET